MAAAPRAVHVPVLITMDLAPAADLEMVGQLVADTLAGCPWSTTAVVGRLHVPPDDAIAGTGAAGADAAAVVVYLAVVRIEPPSLPVDRDQVAAMVNRQVSAALTAAHGRQVTCSTSPIPADVAQRALQHLRPPVWTTRGHRA